MLTSLAVVPFVALGWYWRKYLIMILAECSDALIDVVEGFADAATA